MALVAATALSGSGAAAESARTRQALPPEIVILPTAVSAGGWTPDPAMVLETEKALPAYIRAAAAGSDAQLSKDAGEILSRYATYKRQYSGLTIDGRLVLVVNAFCAWTGDWRRHPVLVLDGGACFFQAWFDPKTRKFTLLSVNGVG
jgi:hypothetical protein